MRGPRYIRTITAVLVAGLVLAAAPAGAQGTQNFNEQQLKLLFAGSKITATGPATCQRGTGKVAIDFGFKADGTFSASYSCTDEFNINDVDVGEDSGTWSADRGALCMRFKGGALARYLPSHAECWPLRHDRIGFALYAGKSRFWTLSVTHPKFASNNELLAALDGLSDSPEASAEPATLPPAEYKPLPVGTRVRYDNWSYTVERSEGFETTIKESRKGRWLQPYAVFGRRGTDSYSLRVTFLRCGIQGAGVWENTFDERAKSSLKSLWPLAVGKKAELEFTDSSPCANNRTWRLRVEVAGTEFLVLGGLRYPTYVVRVHASSEKPTSQWSDFPEQEYTETHWYNPDSGLVLKFEREWIRGGAPDANDRYALASVTYPEGTTTHALKGTPVGKGGDKALLVEVERLKREAEATRAAEEARRAKEAEEERARQAEIARLRKEIEERRQAEEARKAREAEAEKARAAEMARLKREAEEAGRAVAAREARKAEEEKADAAEIARLRRVVEERRKKEAQLSDREARELEAKEKEIARLRQAADERRQAEAARKAREAEAEKARAREIVRLKKEAEDAKQAVLVREARDAEEAEARAAELARLRQEIEERRQAEAARKAREAEDAKARAAEIARLKREAEEAEQARAAEVASLKKEAEKARKAREAEIASLKQALEEAREGSEAGGDDALQALEQIEFGRYHALVIGIDRYKFLPKLKTATADAKAIARVLIEEYGFRVRLLLNARHGEIVDALDEYRETLGPKDNLLIYYAGHGWLDEDADRGFWLPADARPKRRSRWVSNAIVTDTLKAVGAKHVMVVADSCYSGTLVRGADLGPRRRTGDYWKRMAEKWARVAITSGGLEPVSDKGGSGHSPFAKAFIDALAENKNVMDGTQLFSKMRRPVMVAAKQTPQYADVREAGHDGGDFLFVRK